MTHSKNQDHAQNELNTRRAGRPAKGSRGITLALIALALSVCLCAGGVFAWLAYNRDLESNGLELSASASANLVIAATEAEILSANILDTASPFCVTFTDTPVTMFPCTHVNTGSEVKLQYSQIPEEIDYATGLPIQGNATMAAVETDASGNVYYRDFTVYVAAFGAPLEGNTLRATISLPAGVTETDTHKALSVDFYVNDVYVSTLNAAGMNYTNNGLTRTTATLVENGVIPQNNTENGFIKITMRVYFDGNLKNMTTGRTYITSKTLTTENIAFGMKFEAVQS